MLAKGGHLWYKYCEYISLWDKYAHSEGMQQKNYTFSAKYINNRRIYSARLFPKGLSVIPSAVKAGAAAKSQPTARRDT